MGRAIGICGFLAAAILLLPAIPAGAVGQLRRLRKLLVL